MVGVVVRVGTLGRAREVFAAELARLRVTLQERATLDALLDEAANRAGVSRQYYVRSFLVEEAVIALAWRAVTEATGQRPELHAARLAVEEQFPEAAEWPGPVRDLLIDHVALKADAEDMAEAYLGHRSIEEIGPFRYRYQDHRVSAWRSADSDDGTMTVVTVQHRDLVKRPGPLRADPAWGYPELDWAYPFVQAAYCSGTGIRCPRVLWVWADAAVCLAAQRPDLASVRAGEYLRALAGRGSVIVTARVPVERCLLTSHVLWDTTVLRGRYLPASFDDAREFFRHRGTMTLPEHLDDTVLFDAIRESWSSGLIAAGTHPMDLRLQGCLDEIRPEEIVSVVEPDLLVAPISLAPPTGGPLRPRRLDSSPDEAAK